MPQLSKTAQLLRFFAQQYGPPGVPRLRLMKLAYMSDLLAREYLGQPITDFAYYRYTLGPYDDAIIAAIREVVDAGLGANRVEWGENGPTRRLLANGVPIVFDFSAAELEILTYVTTNYLHMDMEEFVRDVVYTTKPMIPLLDAKPKDRKPLDMDQLNGAIVAQYGFRLEDVLEAEAAIRAGKFVTALTGSPIR